MPNKDDTVKAASYPCTNPGASVSMQVMDSRASGTIGAGDLMKDAKYWGGRIRSLTDAVASAVALTALASTGFAQATPNISAIPWAVIMSVVAFTIWITGSVISRMFEKAGERSE